ncbi:YfjI family protein [Streptomyces sp. NPDC017943]|uniref:YfjI family protein n=1 Tax=Streptomyces sp. NPDC017943 TaxID=3365019 RepID=UPI003795AC65
MTAAPNWAPNVEAPSWDRGVHPEDVEGWDEPIPLEPPPAPPLDASKLRGVGAMAQAVADSLQVPVDLPAWLGMAVASTAIGGRRTVSPKPDWVEPVTLYTMPVAAPGEMKSPALGLMAKPVYDEQKRRREEDKAAVARDQQDRRIAESIVTDAESKVIKAKDADGRKKARTDLDLARDELEALGEPKVYTQLIADDTTPEAATDVIAEQGERLAVLSTESSFLGNVGGRYSKNANPEIVLKAWSHEPHAVNRKSGRTLLLERPNLSLGLAVQPGFLTGMGETGDVFEARGLMARFLFSMPVSRVGDRVYDTDPIPGEVRQTWHEAITAMMTAIWDDTEYRQMDLDAHARASFRTFWEALEPRHKAHGDLAAIEGWAKKLPGQVLRLAAVLTLIEDPSALTVPGDVMDDVVSLVPYLIAHARLVSDLMSAERQSKLGPARAVLDWLRRKIADEQIVGRFSANDVEKGVRGQGWCTEMADVHDALDVLVRSGWLRQIDPPERKEGQRGRPQKPRYVAHPDVSGVDRSRVISINSMPRGAA